jgi:hypothetical protein
MEDTHKFGGKTKAVIAFIIGVALFQLIFWTIIKPDDTTPELIATECKADSLQNVINDLQIDLKAQAKEFDNRENKYQNIISEYIYGIEWIEKYHSEAYRDFHRVIAYKERYSRLDEQENIKRLELEKWD